MKSFWEGGEGGEDTFEDCYVNICIFIPLSCILQYSFLRFTICTILKLRLDLSLVYTPLLMSSHFFFHLFYLHIFLIIFNLSCLQCEVFVILPYKSTVRNWLPPKAL